MNVASHHLRCTNPMLTQSQVQAVLLYVLLNEFHLCYIWRLWLLCSYCAWPVLHLLIDDGSVLYPLVCPLQRKVQC